MDLVRNKWASLHAKASSNRIFKQVAVELCVVELWPFRLPRQPKVLTKDALVMKSKCLSLSQILNRLNEMTKSQRKTPCLTHIHSNESCEAPAFCLFCENVPLSFQVQALYCHQVFFTVELTKD